MYIYSKQINNERKIHMKKAGKFLSYLLVLTLIVSLMSGLGFKTEEVKAGDDSTFYVLEIVPDTSMGTFGLLLGDRTLLDKGSTKNWSQSKVQTLVKKFDYEINTGDGSYEYKKPAGATGSNYFESLLKSKGINKSVHLDTVTPGSSLTDELIARADLIVINQTVPDGFSGYTNKTFDDTGCEFENDKVMKVFKKIAGLSGAPVPYVIDFSMYYANGTITGNGLETVDYDISNKGTSKTGPGYLRGSFAARGYDYLLLGINGGAKGINLNLSGRPYGSSRTSYKLLKLLSAIDPATFYGLFFRENDGSYGYDENLNQIFMFPSGDNLLASYNLNMKSSSWLEAAVAPWYISNTDSGNITDPSTGAADAQGKMGWFWASSKTYHDNKHAKSIADFDENIGSGSGNGEIFYSKTNGIFEVFNKTNQTDIANIIGSYSSARTVDHHPYRYLVVTKNRIDSDVNRSVIADMVEYANSENIGLAGGIVVDCMSANQFANISVDLNDTYDGICFESGVSTIIAGSAGAAKYSSYPDSGKIGFTTTALINKFKTDVKSNLISVNYKETPKEYVSKFGVGFQSENVDIYSTDDMKKADLKNNTTFINSGTATYKKLNFDFTVTGADDSYDIFVYVDANNDGKFKGKECITSEAGDVSSSDTPVKIATVSKGGRFNKQISLEKILGKDYAGGFAWKLVIKGSSSRAVSRIGYSALKSNETEPMEIRILQIYPTEYLDNDYKSNNRSDIKEDDASDDAMSHPSLLLPTSSEVSGDITSLTSYEAIVKYLNGKMYICTANSIGTDGKLSGISEDQTLSLSSSASATGGEQKDSLIYNSSLLYYYLMSLKNYKIDTKRYSVYQFNTKFGGNVDGSEDKTSGKEIFYDKTENRFYNYDATGKKAYFDLVILGFGTSMDYMASNATTVIKHYIDNYGTALVGYGTVSRGANNTLGKAIKSSIGMSDALSEGYSLSTNAQGGDTTYMVTNDTILTHYPYSANYHLKGAAVGIGPYKLDVSNEDLIVSYAKYNNQDGAGNNSCMKEWGYSANNYYLYRIKNVTYCGLGKTYANPGWNPGQLGTTMTAADVQIVVNAIINAARIRQSGKADDPYIDCIDPDRSVLIKKEKEPKKEGEPEKPDNYYILWDSVYTDFDSLGMAKTAIAGKNMIAGTVDNDGLISSTSSDGTYRIIPYKYRTVISGGAKLVFSLDDARTNVLSEIKVNGADVTSGIYDLEAAGTYKLYVPLKSSTTGLGFNLTSSSSDDQFEFYLTLMSSDDTVLELHKIIMVRRVLYPVN